MSIHHSIDFKSYERLALEQVMEGDGWRISRALERFLVILYHQAVSN